MGFKLNSYPDITEIPKVVLDKLTEVRCEFRGWDLGDYIVWCKQNNIEPVPFDELINPIDQDRIGEIQKITSSIEEKLNFSWWNTTIRQGITELPKDQKENTKK